MVVHCKLQKVDQVAAFTRSYYEFIALIFAVICISIGIGFYISIHPSLRFRLFNFSYYTGTGSLVSIVHDFTFSSFPAFLRNSTVGGEVFPDCRHGVFHFHTHFSSVRSSAVSFRNERITLRGNYSNIWFFFPSVLPFVLCSSWTILIILLLRSRWPWNR